MTIQYCWKHNRQLDNEGDCRECNGKPPERKEFKVKVEGTIKLYTEHERDIPKLLVTLLGDRGLMISDFHIREND
jgi:hypothetical protein